MSEFIRKRFSDEISDHEKMYRLIAFLEMVGFFICFYISLFFEFKLQMVLIIGVCFLVTIFLFFANIKSEKQSLYFRFVLSMLNLIIPCVLFVNSRGSSIELLMYFISGLVATAYLFENRQKVVLITLNVVVYFVTLFAVFKMESPIIKESLDVKDYITLVTALTVNGIFCSLVALYRNNLISKKMKQSNETTARAQNVGYAKDAFLVNVSHDIRTPLNAIIGTCELMRDKELNQDNQENVEQILNYSKALLSITNILLDFTKLDSNEEVELMLDNYDTTDFVYEICNMFHVQLIDSGSAFFPRVSPDIPSELIGDLGKIRQVVNAVISNCIRYSNIAEIHMNVDFEKTSSNEGVFIFQIIDKEFKFRMDELEPLIYQAEHSTKEFSTKNNSLELVIRNCVQILNAMQGALSVKNIPEVGIVLDVRFVQKIQDEAPIVDTKTFDSKILLFEPNPSERSVLVDLLEQLGMSFVSVESKDIFIEKLKEKYEYILISREQMLENKDSLLTEEFGGKIIMVGNGERDFEGESRVVSVNKPVYLLNLVDALTGRKEEAMKRANRFSPFLCTGAKILVVDDNQINLDVASGMIQRIGADVTCVLSGKECLEKLKTEIYDLIFMDYMMPEMDGIDTLKNIKKLPREEVRNIPVVALTANAVSGSREMFLNAGFDDYLSKPIQIKKLYAMIRELLPEELIHLL